MVVEMAVNDMWLALPVIAVVLLLSLFTMPAPVRESGTEYTFVDGEISTSGANMFSIGGALGQSCCMGNTDGYTVKIDRNLPEGLQNSVMRHENCHIRQYKRDDTRSINEREYECYLVQFGFSG
jgi:hypothetical protein